MKTIKILASLCFATIVLAACGGGSDGGSSSSDPINIEPTGKTYTAELELPAEASEQAVTLNQLSSSVTNVQSSESWLTVTTQTYTSGAPQIKVRWTENTTDSERKSIVTVTTTTNDKLTISVTQKAKAVDTGESHDTVTDKPAL